RQGAGGPPGRKARRSGAARGTQHQQHDHSRGTATGHHATLEYQSAATTSRISSAISVGFCPTLAPAASRASILAWAVLLEPEMMAPAWPIFLPGGAVTPAM